MARRILTAREQHQMLSPWREAAVDPYAPSPGQDRFSPTSYWFHASPYELDPGTVLTPRGGKTTWNRFYNQLDPQQAEEIQNHVWLDNNINISRSRAHGRGHYIYRVEPHTKPRELGLAGGGHSTNAATIQELIEQTPKRQRQSAQEAPKKIYRGVRLTNLPPELHQKINDLQQLPMDESEVGQHLHIGPMLLDHLHNTPWKPFTQTPDHLQYTGLGRHWSRRKEFAQLAASNQVGPGLGVVLEADDPGEHHYDARTGDVYLCAPAALPAGALPGALELAARSTWEAGSGRL